MKSILCTVVLLGSVSAFSADDCLRFFSHADRAKIVMKKNCSMILEDQGRIKVASIEGCFTKIENQFRGTTSWGFVADLQKQRGYVTKDVIIVNTGDATENSKQVKIDIKTASPELLKFYRHKLVFDKETETLSISKDQGTFRLKNQYALKLQCR